MKTIHANGIDFAYKEAGDGPLVLCLHGFPDTAETWGDLLPELAAAGYHAVAPQMRGYPPSSAPTDGNYSVPELGRDALALIDAFGAEKAVIIGHDWGAITGYAAANIAPDKVSRLITAAIPHPRMFRLWPRQLKKSWYIAFFQLRGLAERTIKKNDFAFIDKLWKDWSPGWDYSNNDIASIKQALSDPKGLNSALAYYRALISALTGPDRRENIKLVFAKTSVPTLTIAGSTDGCMGLELFDQNQTAFTGEFRLDIIEKAGHFMHRERPARFRDAVLGFLNSDSGSSQS